MRYEMHYGMYPSAGEKGYVIIDTKNEDPFNKNRKYVFTSHNKGETIARLDELNKMDNTRESK